MAFSSTLAKLPEDFGYRSTKPIAASTTAPSPESTTTVEKPKPVAVRRARSVRKVGKRKKPVSKASKRRSTKRGAVTAKRSTKRKRKPGPKAKAGKTKRSAKAKSKGRKLPWK